MAILGQLAGHSRSAYTTSPVSDPSTISRTRAWVEVRLDRLRENAAAVQRAIGARAGLVPMVKAEAYGLGMLPVVEALRDPPGGPRPWAFGVATVVEGERLRSSGYDGRILVFTPTPPEEYSRAVTSRLTLAVSELEAVERLSAAAAEQEGAAAFHLEVNTGMGRAGFPGRRRPSGARQSFPRRRSSAGKAPTLSSIRPTSCRGSQPRSRSSASGGRWPSSRQSTPHLSCTSRTARAPCVSAGSAMILHARASICTVDAPVRKRIPPRL